MNLKKGVSGNRNANKMYSFNTSIRVPDKNIEFLKIIKKYEGKLFKNDLRIQIYKDAISCGALTPLLMTNVVREKIRKGEALTEDEMEKVLTDNKPENGFAGRVGDYIMSLENQALVQRLGKSKSKYRVRVTDLGNALLEDISNEVDVYTKAMLALEYGSVIRSSSKNKSIPFLNTIFVIHELQSLLSDFKGITLYEFGVFVLTMKNCNYKKIVNEIIKYREKFNYKEDNSYAYAYLNKNDIASYDWETLRGSRSYADEVLRKFKKTGLIAEKRKFTYRFISFNKHELDKVELLLKEYQGYKWKKFKDADDYFESIETLLLPWESSSANFYQILKSKAEKIHYKLSKDNITKEDYDKINRMYYQSVFESNDYSQFPYESIVKELQLITKKVSGKSVLEDLQEYIRLEWFTTLLLANKFGKKSVKGNLSLDSNGLPVSQAGGNSADIEMESNQVHYNIEVTTIRDRSQQLNAETTTVARHMVDEGNKNSLKVRALMIAPFIHRDTVRYYRFESKDLGVVILPITIDMLIKIVEDSKDFIDFDEKICAFCEKMNQETVEEFQHFVNNYNSGCFL